MMTTSCIIRPAQGDLTRRPLTFLLNCFIFERRLFFAKTQHAVQIIGTRRPLEKPSILEPLDVGEVAQRGEPKDRQKFLRRDIGERRPGLGRAQAGVNEFETLQAADDVAADLPANQSRDVCTSRGLEISDRRDSQKFGRRQFGMLAAVKIRA